MIDEDIYTKPNCSPMCDHTKVCTRCNRPKCIKSMVHNRLHGYTCYCGNDEYRNVLPDINELVQRRFDAIHLAGKRLKEIFKRDKFKYQEGAEDYIIRAVKEALGE